MKNICHILNVRTSNEDVVGATPKILVYLDLQYYEQRPSVVNDLKLINSITLQVLSSNATENLTPFAPGTPQIRDIAVY